jgi:Holliday junction resolvase RusA-like endonuclease
MSEILFQCKISGRVRSKKNSKQLFKNKRTGKMFISSSDLFKKWALFAACYINRAKNKETIDYPCNLNITAHYSNNKHCQDADNVAASICDVLENCGVIKNDNLIHLLVVKKVYNKESDFIEIELRSL